VEGAYKQFNHSRCKCAGMRWKSPGLLNVLALRVPDGTESLRNVGRAMDSRSRHRHHLQNEGTSLCYIECELFDNSSM
jgi:hypothetical protein